LLELSRYFADLTPTDHRPPKESIDLFQEQNTVLQTLGAQTAVVQYLTTADTLYIVLRTSQQARVFKHMINERDLQKQIRLFSEAVQNPKLDPQMRAQALHQTLIAPLMDDLRRDNIKTLMFSLEGPLHRVAMSALFDGHQYLAQQYDLVLLTQTQLQALLNKPIRPLRVAAFGVTRALQGFEALPSVRREIKDIVQQNKSLISDSEVYFDEQFNERQLAQILAKKFPVLHIASHFPWRQTMIHNLISCLAMANT